MSKGQRNFWMRSHGANTEEGRNQTLHPCTKIYFLNKKEMKAITKYNYNNFDITFSGENDVMVNATEMAKVFGKTVKDWMRLEGTKEFIDVLSIKKDIPISEKADKLGHICPSLIRTTEGRNGSTWFHKYLAIEFARWLSPEFAIWCNDRIFEIIENEISHLKEENNRLQNQAPFPVCKKSISMQSFANFLTTFTGEKIGRTTLFAICRKLKYIQVESTRPYQKYINNGFFEVAVKDDNVVPLVTPKGQVYMSKRIHKLCSKNKILSYPLF